MSDVLTLATTALMLQLKVREDELDDVFRELGSQKPVGSPSQIVAQVRAVCGTVHSRRVNATREEMGWM